MRYFLLFTLFISLIISSCRKDIIHNTELKIEGTWEFSSASQRPYGGFIQESIFNEYQDDQITFLDDKQVIYTDRNGSQLTGIWELKHLLFNNGSDSADGYIISISLVDSANNIQQYIWELQNINISTRLRVEENTTDYTYCYVLKKQ